MSYEEFAIKVLALTGIDLHAYKQHQMERRIRSFMSRYDIQDLGDYFDRLRTDREMLNKFLDRITINVSELFRNPDKFLFLKNEVFPAMLKKYQTLKIWSAGCSYGAEPYSVAIVLDELTPEKRYKILATDIDRRMLLRAREGIFDQHDIKHVDEKRLHGYFDLIGDKYQIKSKIRSRVSFKLHDLIKWEPKIAFDLIICRNVVIYFTDEAKEILYQNFYKALKKEGILFVGSTERIFNYQSIGFTLVAPFFYRK